MQDVDAELGSDHLPQSFFWSYREHLCPAATNAADLRNKNKNSGCPPDAKSLYKYLTKLIPILDLNRGVLSETFSTMHVFATRTATLWSENFCKRRNVLMCKLCFLHPFTRLHNYQSCPEACGSRFFCSHTMLQNEESNAVFFLIFPSGCNLTGRRWTCEYWKYLNFTGPKWQLNDHVQEKCEAY